MKAVVYTSYGGPEVLTLKDLEKPTPKETEALVKIHFSAVNRTDCGFREPHPYFVRLFEGLFTPQRYISGTEFVGEIVEIGQKVVKWKVGDRVFGFHDEGFKCHAEFMVMSETDPKTINVGIIPDGVSFKDAASCIEGQLYANGMVKGLNIQKDHKVLINGSTGSVGSSFVQLLREVGCEITAVCNTKNIDLIKSIGATRVIDYQKEDFRKVEHEHKYDFIIDNVIESSFGSIEPLLKEGGVYCPTDLGPWHCQNPLLILWTKMFGSKKVVMIMPDYSGEPIKHFEKLLKEGKWVPIIDRVYNLDEIVEATKYVETGQKTGAVLIKVCDDDK